MPKFDLKKYILGKASQLKKINWPKIRLPKIHLFFKKLISFLASWWHIVLLSLIVFVSLYYPLGGFLINKVDKTIDYEISANNPQQSATVEMTAFLINREINEKMWTPNLPFFFPSFFLDNMPNFQLGMMKAISNLTTALSYRLDSTIVGGEEELHLKTAAELLKYDGHIWMFSPANNFTPVPSAHSQYRKARKQLIKFNQNLNSGHLAFYRNPDDLVYFLNKINKDLNKSINQIDAQVREESSSFTDFKADNIFYYNQGKVYAYYLLLKALGNDYKDVLVNKNAYILWTRSLKALEDGAGLDSVLIRNGSLNSLTAPNHLQYLVYYIVKAKDANQSIIKALQNDGKKD